MTDQTDPFGLVGKVVLVTGASRGLGLAVAEELARGGAEGIAIAGRNLEAIKVAAKQVAETGTACVGVAADVTREDEVDDLVARTFAEYGRIDVVINNAGGAAFKASVRDMRPDGWQKMIEQNLFSTFLVSRAVLRWWGVEPSAGRSIVNVGSTSSLRAFPELAYYSASKHGLVGLTKTLAREVAASGVRVNLVCPHLLATQLTETYQSDPHFERYVDDIPMGRWGDVAEVARVVRFLASDAASYVTGSVLTVDGGWST